MNEDVRERTEEGDWERYADCETESGEILIYDTENDDAWIQSDNAVHRSWFV